MYTLFMNSCSEDARQVAVVGFLQILKNFRFHLHSMNSSLSQTSMSSQATVDVHHSQTSSTNRWVTFSVSIVVIDHSILIIL